MREGVRPPVFGVVPTKGVADFVCKVATWDIRRGSWHFFDSESGEHFSISGADVVGVSVEVAEDARPY